MTDRRTDLLTNTVTYRDANVVYNSLNTQIRASLPVNSLKTQKSKVGQTDQQTDRQTDRQIDRLTKLLVVARMRLKRKQKTKNKG